MADPPSKSSLTLCTWVGKLCHRCDFEALRIFWCTLGKVFVINFKFSRLDFSTFWREQYKPESLLVSLQYREIKNIKVILYDTTSYLCSENGKILAWYVGLCHTYVGLCHRADFRSLVAGFSGEWFCPYVVLNSP